MGATTAQAADEASIAYVEARDGGLLQLLVSVPHGQHRRPRRGQP